MWRGGGGRFRLIGCAPLLMAVAVGGYGPVADVPYPALPSPLTDPASGTVRTIEGRPPRVLIVGDSIADQHGSHAAMALRQGGVEVHLATQWGASLLSRDQYDMGRSQAEPAPGSLMAQATKAVVLFDPDIVAVYSNHNYWAPHPRNASGQEIRHGTPDFTAMAQAQLRELNRRLTQNGARVYLVEPFPFEGLPPKRNPIWASYMALHPELGFGVIRAGRVLTTPDGQLLPVLGDCSGLPASLRPPDDEHLSYLGAGLMGTATAQAVVAELGVELPPEAFVAPTEAPVALLPDGLGYQLVTCDGATFGFSPRGHSLAGGAAAGGRPDGDPVVAATTAPFGRQGWSVTRSGVALPLGRAETFGDASLGGRGQVAVGIASAPHASGYWVATSTGEVQAFGSAPPLGDLAGQGEQVVAMASAPDRRGYWLLTASGRVEGSGSAHHFGDRRGAGPGEPLVAMASHPRGQGYWLLDRAGNVHAYGAARDQGSAAHQDLARLLAWRGFGDYDTEVVPASEAPTHAVGLLPTVSGEGYWIALANGAVCRFGDAVAQGGLHVTEVQVLQPLLGVPFYGPGPCSNRSTRDPFSAGGDRVEAPSGFAMLG